jgi:hypothetical protein
MGRTKTEVRDKLKELHQQAENGLRPRRHYTVNDAAALVKPPTGSQSRAWRA